PALTSTARAHSSSKNNRFPSIIVVSTQVSTLPTDGAAVCVQTHRARTKRPGALRASRLKLVRRQCGEPGIVHGATHGEVIQALPGIVVDSKQGMHLVIEETTNSRGAHAGSLGFKIEDLPQHARFPEEIAVAPWFMHGGFELRKHSERKTRVGADVLMAAHRLGKIAAIMGQQQVQRQMGPPDFPP